MTDSNECPIDHANEEAVRRRMEAQVQRLVREIDELKLERHILQYTLDAVLKKATEGEQ